MQMKMNQIKKIVEFYDKLGDEESKRLFEARLNFAFHNDIVKFIDSVLEEEHAWNMVFFDKYYQRILKNEQKSEKKIVLFGAGNAGRQNLKLLQMGGYPIGYMVDSSPEKIGSFCEGGVEICSPSRLYTDEEKPIVVISISDVNEVRNCYEILAYGGVEPERIYWEACTFAHLLAVCGMQYFDLPYLIKEKEEIFVDAGCFDGMTTRQFAEWAGDSFIKAFAFEPDSRSIPTIEQNMSDLIQNGQFKLHNTGLYHEKTKLYFNESGVRSGSCLSEMGKTVVPVESIDGVLKGEKISFIKMDIEGAELNALKGASESICRWKPKLAISLYHKDQDIVEIPLYLLEIMPEYQFYIRHYTTAMGETVLYAV